MSVIHRGDEQMPTVRLHLSHVASFILLLILAAVFFAGVHGFYFQNNFTGVYRTAAKFLPIPAATVDGDIIWYKQISEIANLLKVTDNDEVVFDSAVEAVIRQKIVENLANELGVRVEDVDVALYQYDLPTQFLNEIGWSDREYKKYVIEPLILAQKTEEVLQYSYDYQYAARDQLNHVLLSLEIGIPFYDLAKQYSEDGSAIFGGDIGIYEKFELPDGMESVWDQEVGEVSDILDLGDSYALVQVYDDVVLDEERTHVALMLISVNKAPLSEVIEDYAETQEVKVFVR